MVLINNLDRCDAVRLYDKLSGTNEPFLIGVTRKRGLDFDFLGNFLEALCLSFLQTIGQSSSL